MKLSAVAVLPLSFQVDGHSEASQVPIGFCEFVVLLFLKLITHEVVVYIYLVVCCVVHRKKQIHKLTTGCSAIRCKACRWYFYSPMCNIGLQLGAQQIWLEGHTCSSSRLGINTGLIWFKLLFDFAKVIASLDCNSKRNVTLCQREMCHFALKS